MDDLFDSYPSDWWAGNDSEDEEAEVEGNEIDDVTDEDAEDESESMTQPGGNSS